MSRRERAFARFLLVVVVVAAGLPLWLAQTEREPYPGLIMPGFSHPGGGAETTQSTTPDITVRFADGSAVSLTPRKLVNTPVHAARIVKYNFSRGLDAEGQLRRRGDPPDREVLLNGWNRGTAPRRSVERARDPRTLDWLRGRLAELHPDRTPANITFEWTRRTHRIPEGTVIDTELLQTVEVDL